MNKIIKEGSEIHAGDGGYSISTKEKYDEFMKVRNKSLAQSQIKELTEQANFPNKKYKIIYADPPWSYKDKALAGNRGAGCKYEVQSKSWIDNLPVNSIADNDCVLFIWVTMPKLNEVFDAIKNWGFEYKTCGFTWVKRNKKSNTWFMGMGNWTRANAELCLIAVKGKPKRINAGIKSIIDDPVEFHSKKPDIVRHKIVELLGDLPRIELFARQKTEGWDVWGNEITYSEEKE